MGRSAGTSSMFCFLTFGSIYRCTLCTGDLCGSAQPVTSGNIRDASTVKIRHVTRFYCIDPDAVMQSRIMLRDINS